ncbi:Nucleoside phosphorylase domain protein [Raphanus sativus]|nr:Nucleoside phosphorylase domain protein [Raphanus sativus]
MGGEGVDETTREIESEKSLGRPISTVVFVIAMQAEAQPLVNKLGLSQTTCDDSPLGGSKGLPWVVYQGFHRHLRIYVVCPGKDPSLGKLYSSFSPLIFFLFFCFSNSVHYELVDVVHEMKLALGK